MTCRLFVALALFAFPAAPVWGQTPRQLATARRLMVESDVATAGIKHPAILAALAEVPRHEFVPADVRAYAYLDMALPIGEQQTISPPFIVAWMTEQLDPQPGDSVLEIGTGSGYQAAVLSRLVTSVYTIEINERLARQARRTIERVGYQNVAMKHGDGYAGWAEHAPFDKILVTCSPEKVPPALVEQLREGGRLVVPLGERYQQTLFSLVKQDGKLVVRSREPTFFVPMTGRAEALRSVSPNEPLVPLANGDFEQLLEPGKPTAWYYLRQARLAAGGPEGSQHCLLFANRVAGQGSQALQAIGVDGRRVSSLDVDVWVKGRAIEPAAPTDPQGGAKLAVSFFDADRAPVGNGVAGVWQGTFDWRLHRGRIAVPHEARIGIVTLGLLGATGELECDAVELRPRLVPRTAQR